MILLKLSGRDIRAIFNHHEVDNDTKVYIAKAEPEQQHKNVAVHYKEENKLIIYYEE